MSKALDDHNPTVIVGKDGLISYTSDQINTVKIGQKVVKVVPSTDERIESLWKHRNLFTNLTEVLLLMTNACNLSCTYCYEQHKKDFGRFTVDKIRQVWDWLRDLNDNDDKVLQFFGGEPLIHKQIILDFLRENKEEIFRLKGKQSVCTTTNGLLLTDDFIDEYFTYPGNRLIISLDTIDATRDHRGVGQANINKLLDNIEKISKKVDSPFDLDIRATISREGAPHLKTFWNELYNRGVRKLTFHPLILSYGSGYIEWPDDEWNKFSNDIADIIRTSREVVHFHVAEGVGKKHKTNCMVGSDEIAIDASGDFSGCYFFTNRKDTTGNMILGNLFDDTLYVDRYQNMVSAYAAMYDQHEECRNCEVNGLCYQCPAGNLSTSGQLFRPDGMCKRFVKLSADMAFLNVTKRATSDLIKSIAFYTANRETGLTQLCVQTMEKYFSISPSKYDIMPTNYKLVLGYFHKLISDKSEPSNIVDEALSCNEEMDARTFYYDLLSRHAVVDKIKNIERFYPNNEEVAFVAMIEIITNFHSLTPKMAV